MSNVQRLPELKFLSELYARDAPGAVLLAEYPSSNSDETQFQNRSQYLIHDPFPPPSRSLIKVLGPHHLMCGWGRRLAVSSELAPPPQLLEHWRRVFGSEGCPEWQPCPLDAHGAAVLAGSEETQYITLFPHEALPPHRQVIDPEVNYEIHSKRVIAEIDCRQAEVLDSIVPPCLVKLSHGYAGLGNFLILNEDDEVAMRRRLAAHWLNATIVVNAIIEGLVGDYGVQFYLAKDGAMVWLGLTEQQFDASKKWCGGAFSASLQTELFDRLRAFVEPVGEYLHRRGYFGVVGIDVLRNAEDQFFLVDVNPRLTGVSPFLMASRIFAREAGLSEGVYQASRQFPGSLEQLLAAAERTSEARVVVYSAFEQSEGTAGATTVCHLSVSSDSQARNRQVLSEMGCAISSNSC